MVTLQQLQTLLAVAATGSISAGARRLRISQPVLSRTLQQLEQSVGAPLVQRSARGAILTESGEALVARARLVDAELRRAREEIDHIRGMRSGRVAVACSPVAMMFILPVAMAAMRTDFPKVEVRVSEEVYPPAIDALREGRVDFVLGPVASGGLGPEFTVTRLFDVELVVAVSRDHPRAGARSLATLAAEEWIVTGPASGPGAVVEQLFRKHRLTPPRCVIYLETIFSAVEMIKHTHLAGLLPAPVAAAAGDAIRAVPIRERCEPLSLCMVIPTRTMLTPAARALVSAVRTTSASWSQAKRGQTRRGA